MNAWEQQEEKQDAAIWHRPQRKYIYDKPTYPFFPPAPIIPRINFDLMYSE